MVVKMMRWRPWPPLISKKYEVKLSVHRVEAFDSVHGGFSLEIRWKGPKNSLASLRRTVRRNCTREEVVKSSDKGVLVEWNEEFLSVCSLSGYRDNAFHPWEISFSLVHGLSSGAKSKVPVVGSAVLNLAEYASKSAEEVVEVKVPLTVTGAIVQHGPSLCISLSFLELRGAQPPTESVQSPIMPVLLPSTPAENPCTDEDEVSAIKAGLRKFKILTEYVSTRRTKKHFHEEEGSDGRLSSKSEEDESAYTIDFNSTDEFDEGESTEVHEDSSIRKSFSYGTLAGASHYSIANINDEDGDWFYYSNRRSDVGCSYVDHLVSMIPEQIICDARRSILPWKKRKLSFRSPKAKGEPLLKNAYGEEGGDDIDFDRRQLTSDESLSSWQHKTEEESTANQSSIPEFGGDSFAVGSWERKEITSRDGRMKIQTQVFFATFDQRSDWAGGESACTALVVVIADWLQNNHNLMPNKSQFDSLIGEGSREWRSLYKNELHQERFPDKHFDLETVLQAKIRDLCVLPGKSFIGFFHPDHMEEGDFDFLHGAMSFDNIWDEISCTENSSNGEAQVFIVSWNDHFFILKVEMDAYYIIDTLGERLHEGCTQAYILKFDKNTIIHNMRSSHSKSVNEQQERESQQWVQECEGSSDGQAEEPKEEEGVAMCGGKESCKEYIKNFLAAIPIRELQADLKKGLKMQSPLHQRLQVEFHFTNLLLPSS